MNSEEYKAVKDVFKDYRSIEKDLLEARIKSINLFKKTNSLELILLAKKRIKIRQIESFEQYLEARFGIKTIEIKVEIENEVKDDEEKKACETVEQDEIAKSIEKEWIDIIDYMSNKHPMTKAILRESKISVEQNTANVLLSFKGKEFLLAKKFDEILSKLLLDIYGKKYKVSYIEDISDEILRKRQEYAEELQKQAIIDAQKEAVHAIEEQENKVSSNYNSEIPPMPDIPFDDKDMPVGEEEYLQELEALEEENNIILGTLSKAKENKVKIKDIAADNKKITVEGRIVSCEARETKTGKGMLIYDLYDGTGIITCKSFTSNIQEGNEVAEKIRKASGIKTIGKAGLDAFAGDVTIMANTILEINGDAFPKLPTEDEDSPLILGMNMQIKEPLVKIQDLSVDSGNVCIDGEVIAMEDRELKGGKILLSLDVYDGTSTMTCKAFLTKENSKKVIGKIKGAKGIKLAGKAGMDTFSNELTIMANTILVSDGIKR